MAVGVVLLYSFRVFERQWGSQKFASFCAVSWVLSMIFELLLLVSRATDRLASGPVCFLFALLVAFALDIPAVSAIVIFELRFSDKIVTYLMAFQLLLLGFPSTAWSALTGCVVALLYRLTFLRVSSLRFPASFASFCANALAPYLGEATSTPEWATSAPPADVPPLPTASSQSQDAPSVPLSRHPVSSAAAAADAVAPLAANSAAAVIPPEESNAAILIGMGFPESDALRALRENGNDVARAVDALVQSATS